MELNRDRNGQADKRPTLTDLRESGDLENTADSVIGLYRDELEHADSPDKGLAELIVLKKPQYGVMAMIDLVDRTGGLTFEAGRFVEGSNASERAQHRRWSSLRAVLGH